MTRSTTSFISAATTSPPASIEPPGPRPFRPGPRSPVWPLRRSRQDAQPKSRVSLRPQPHKLTMPAEELRQIEAIAMLGDEARHDVPQHATARISAPERDMSIETATPVSSREPDEADAVRRLKDENLNLRIDNRAKETVIAELNRRLNEDRDKFVGAMQDMSYKLGAAETRLAQIEAPKIDDDTARQSVPEHDTQSIEPAIAPTPAVAPGETASAAPAEMPVPALEPRRSFFGRLFR